MEATVIKQGDTKILMTFRRSGHGLTVSVKANAAVEDLARSFGAGDLQEILHGRHWTPIPPEAPLRIYGLGEGGLPLMLTPSGVQYRIDLPGQQLIYQGGGDEVAGMGQQAFRAVGGGGIGIAPAPRNQFPQGMGITNISFLRLAGISDGAGVTFGVRGVYTTEQISQIKDRMQEACKAFYRSYLLPVGLTLGIYESSAP